MQKLDKLIARKRVRDQIDDIIDPIVQGLCSLHYSRREPLCIPHFFVSSAPAATLLHLTDTWCTHSAGIRMVVTVAASALPPQAGPVSLPKTSALMTAAAATGLSVVPEVVLLHRQLALGPDEKTIVGILRPEAIDAYIAFIVEREARLAMELDAAAKAPETTVTVPMYYLHVPMVDDGSQRIAPVMPGLSRLLDALASCTSNSVCWNTNALRCLLRTADSSCAVSSPSPSAQETAHACGDTSIDSRRNPVAEITCGAAVLVHCLQGVSRSVAVVLWYLMVALATCGGRCGTGEIVGVRQLLEWTRQARPCACPNLCFAAELNSMEARLRRDGRLARSARGADASV